MITSVNPAKDTWNGRCSFSGGSHMTPRNTKWYMIKPMKSLNCIVPSARGWSHSAQRMDHVPIMVDMA